MEESGFFPGAEGDLYGRFFRPCGSVLKCAILLHPFGEEKKASARLLVRTARLLCEYGIAAFTFDLSGTGDSSGKHSEVDFQRWSEDISGALHCVRETADEPDIAFIGFRLGANLALKTATSAETVVLVEPLLSGKEYLNELLRRKQIKAAMAGRDGENIEELFASQWQNGQCADLDGFSLNSQLAEDLRNLSLEKELEQLHSELKLSLIRVSSVRKLPASWNPVAAVQKKKFRTEPVLVRDKPFWGQIEYYESDLVINEIMCALHGFSDGQGAK